MANTQIRPAQRIDYTDPGRGATSNPTGSSLDVAAQDLDALLASVLVSNDHMDTVLVDDIGRSAGMVSQMTVNDKQHCILEYVREGGVIDYTAIFNLVAGP